MKKLFEFWGELSAIIAMLRCFQDKSYLQGIVILILIIAYEREKWKDYDE